MNVIDTNQNNVKCCSKCGEEKPADRIIKNRKICKACCQKKIKERLEERIKNLDITIDKACIICNIVKNITLFSRKAMSNICLDCKNNKSREKYSNNEEIRKKACKQAIDFKQKKKAIRDEIKKEELEKLEADIGKENTICKYCNKVKAKTRFRHNRLKCRECERDDPKYKLHRLVRIRISEFLKSKNNKKSKHTCEYLGCTRENYIKWLCYNNNGFTIDNHGTEWHIDHVIPLSKFNHENKEEMNIAFNWRNTMALSAKDNLAKNNKILKQQIEQHYKTLQDYHTENKIELPQIFKDLYAKHLAAGNPLEP
jgi:hypothetical protein